MDIKNYMGFSKKGAETKTEAEEEKNHGFQFSDKYLRENGETRIYDHIILRSCFEMSQKF